MYRTTGVSFNYTYGVTIQVTPVLQEDSLRALSAFAVKTEYGIHPEDARTQREEGQDGAVAHRESNLPLLFSLSLRLGGFA